MARHTSDGRKGFTGRNRKRKRIFNPPRVQNQNTNNEKKDEVLSASARKIDLEEYPAGEFEGYRIFDLFLLIKSLESAVVCKECKGAIKIQEEKLKGLGAKYTISCEKCRDDTIFHSSEFVEGGNGYEINRRMSLAMRCIGQGQSGTRTFCGMMDLPPPVQLSTSKLINAKILDATSSVLLENLKKAVEEEVLATTDPQNEDSDSDSENDDNRKIVVQCDASWHRRGFSSLNGVCTVIGTETGKVIDQEVLSSFCQVCRRWENEQHKPTVQEWEEWREDNPHECSKNFTGSAGAMEVEGMLRIFKRSVEKHQVKYMGYIGDGDTKSYTKVKEAEPYGPHELITKIECVGHVQKRFGSRLRQLKASYKGKKLSDGKVLSGKSRLTDTVINEMQSYYGNAIRGNSSSIEDMRTAVWAIWYHKSSTDEHPKHQFCPPGRNSWCKYRRAEATGILDFYKHPKSLPMPVMEAIKPVFEALTSTELLKRCIGGKTQNANESLHSVIWRFCPKIVFVSKRILQIGAALATIIFNIGIAGLLDVLKALGSTPGRHAVAFAKMRNRKRVLQAQRQAEAATKEARTERRRVRIERMEEDQETTYSAGGF